MLGLKMVNYTHTQTGAGEVKYLVCCAFGAHSFFFAYVCEWESFISQKWRGGALGKLWFASNRHAYLRWFYHERVHTWGVKTPFCTLLQVRCCIFFCALCSLKRVVCCVSHWQSSHTPKGERKLNPQGQNWRKGRMKVGFGSLFLSNFFPPLIFLLLRHHLPLVQAESPSNMEREGERK